METNLGQKCLYIKFTIQKIAIVPNLGQNQNMELGRVKTTPRTIRGRESIPQSLWTTNEYVNQGMRKNKEMILFI